MSNVFRLRRGPERAVEAPINQSVAVQVGDLVYQDTDGSAKPAGSLAWSTNLAGTQAAFNAAFWGVSRDQRLGTETNGVVNILVDAQGCFEFPCAALGSELEAGVFVGPDKASGNALLPQQLVSVADAAHAIGRLSQRAPVGSTTLLVDLVSTIIYGPAK